VEIDGLEITHVASEQVIQQLLCISYIVRQASKHAKNFSKTWPNTDTLATKWITHIALSKGRGCKRKSLVQGSEEVR